MSNPSDRSSFPPSAMAMLALLTLAWGMNWPIMKVALSEIPVWTFRSFCVGAGATGLFLLAWLGGHRVRVPRGRWLQLATISLFNITAWNVLVVHGLSYLPSGRTSILAFTMPMWAVLFSRVLIGEEITGRRLLGLILGMTGMAILLMGDARALSGAPVGALLVLSAAAAWALGVVLMKKFAIPLPATSLTGWQMLIGGAPIVLGALLFDRGELQPVSFWPVMAVLYNMFVCFIFCYWAWTRIVTMVPVAVSGLSVLMTPIIGVFSGMLLLGEQPGWQEFTAMALVVGAIAAVLLPARERPQRARKGNPIELESPGGG